MRHIATPDGGYTTLGNVSQIRETSGAMNIAREAGRRTMAIGIFIKDRNMGSIVKDMKARVEKNVKVPANYAIKWSGEFENQERAMQRLAVVVPISLLLIFVLLFDAFGSFKKAVLILFNVPLALIDGFVALSVFQQLSNAGHGVLEAAQIGSLQRLHTVLRRPCWPR